jgi:hypothetical protein
VPEACQTLFSVGSLIKGFACAGCSSALNVVYKDLDMFKTKGISLSHIL